MKKISYFCSSIMDTSQVSIVWQIANMVFFSVVGIIMLVLIVVLVKGVMSHIRIRKELKRVAIDSIRKQELMRFTMEKCNAYLWEYVDGEFRFSDESMAPLPLSNSCLADFLKKEEPGVHTIQFQHTFSPEDSMQPGSTNRRSKQEQSQACLDYALQGGGRPEVNDGQPHWYELCMRVQEETSPATEQKELTRRGVMVLIDDKITRLHKAEEARQLLIKATELENCLQRIKNEIKIPTNIMRGYSEVMMTIGDEFSEAERKKYYHDISTCSYIMSKIVDDVLQLSRIDNNQEQYHMDHYKLSILMAENFSRHSDLLLKRKNMQVVIDTGEDDAVITVDRAAFNRILANFLSNAAKFSPRNSLVHIGWKIEGTDALIYVQDQGIGIPPEHHDNIFLRFFKVDTSLHGLGIGLALVRFMATDMGGQVGVESTPGCGSRFWVSFPIKTTATSDLAQEPPLTANPSLTTNR